jgi:isopentenyl phosphate kinase
MQPTNSAIVNGLILLKLGGSLITDKHQPHTARMDMIERLVDEIRMAWREKNGLPLVLGHGSGSFGHVPASKHQTRQSVRSRQEWLGFTEVWYEAQLLNRLVMDALVMAGLPAIGLSPLASAVAHDGRISQWNLEPVRRALEVGLLPVVYGDVVFDRQRGATILSTEDLFSHLAVLLKPQRMLLAGIEAGVWADFPACTRLVAEITPSTYDELSAVLAGSAATDVTGGMSSKVGLSLALVEQVAGLKISIFSGEAPGSLYRALLGSLDGTLIHSG